MKKLLTIALLISLLNLNLLAFTPLAYSEDEDVKSEEKEPVEKLSREETLKLLELFGDVFEKVRKDYVEEVSDRKIIEASINGMLTSLDPHSSFMNAEDFKEMKEQTKGQFGGLGIEVTMKNGLVYVVAPIDDTPAFKAGIKAGDYISHINGQAVYGMTISEAVKKMRGKPKTNIDLKIVREGEKKPLELAIIRDIIKVKSVKSKTYGDVGYIRITSFTENTSKMMIDEITKIQNEIGKGKIKGLVLDFRNNPGGLLTEAISISDAFLNKGEIVSTKGRHKEDAQKYSATAGDITNGLPIVVLINSGSASASEIVAGALQDQRRAVILGEKSFGKGSVQTVMPLPGDTAIRLTTSRYYTPSGSSIQAEGITPDIEVAQGKLTPDDVVERTKEAELKGHLENDNGKSTADDKAKIDKNLLKEIKAEKNKDKKLSAEDKLKQALFGDKDGEKGLYETDYQLGRAIDTVRSLYLYTRDR